MASLAKLSLRVGLAATVWLSATAMAGTVTDFGPEDPVGLADFRPHLSEAEWYKESWNHNAWTSDGHFIAVDFTITNIGIGDRKASYKAMIKGPNDARSLCKGELDADQWSWDRKGFGLRFGKAEVSGDEKLLTVAVRCKKLKMDLRFENRASPIQPGSGALRFDAKGSYRKVYHQARARVTGTIRAEGKSLKVDAPGMVAHTTFDLAPHEFSQRWFKFKQVGDDISIVLTELQTPEKYGRARRGWALVYDDSGRLLASARAQFEFDGFIQDKQSPEGYRIPRRVRLSAVDGQSQLTGEILLTRVNNVQDPTDDMNMVVRSLARRYSKPRQYDIACKYSLNLKTNPKERTFSGEGKFRFGYVNPE